MPFLAKLRGVTYSLCLRCGQSTIDCGPPCNQQTTLCQSSGFRHPVWGLKPQQQEQNLAELLTSLWHVCIHSGPHRLFR